MVVYQNPSEINIQGNHYQIQINHLKLISSKVIWQQNQFKYPKQLKNKKHPVF